jgi:hypothetical protein
MKHRPTQMEFGLDLGTEGPLEPVEVTDGELARTVAELRERGLWVWAMDIRRGSYLLHLRRAPDPDTPPLGRLPLMKIWTGYGDDRVATTSFPTPTKETSAPLNANESNRIRQALWT